MQQFSRNILVALAVVILPSTLSAADVKIGYIDLAKAAEASPQWSKAQKKLEKEFATRTRDLTQEQKELEELAEKFQKDSAIMSEAERTRLQREIARKQRNFEQERRDIREDVDFRRNELLTETQLKVVETARALSKAESFDLVISQGVIFASGAVDITDKLIERLKAADGG
ncbi:MAG: OmpH family outer membrane protein [Pseudomonadota bacterium]